MVSAKGLYYNSAKTKQLLTFPENCKCKVVQIFGSDALIMGEVVKNFGKEYDIIDINMGCPAPKIYNNGDGCALMKDLDKAYQIIRSCVQNAQVPVTVKFRSGVDSEHINAVEFAKMCEKAGASAITIHARTREQGYSGKADWELIKQVVQAVNIPVIGNGDVTDRDSYLKIKEQTGCQGVMIGRGALGKPEVFSKILCKKEHFDKKHAILEHIKELQKYYSEEFISKHMRKHLLWYLAGKPKMKEYKEKANKVASINDIKELINSAYDKED